MEIANNTILEELVIDKQEQDEWCWSAVATGIDYFYDQNSPWTQCRVAAAQKGAGKCCNSPKSSTCDRPWFLERALCTVHRLGNGPVPGQLSFEQLTALIQAEDPHPVCAQFSWEGEGSHFVAIKGLDVSNRMLVIADPMDGAEHTVAYDELIRKGYGGFGPWTAYFITDKVNHGGCI